MWELRETSGNRPEARRCGQRLRVKHDAANFAPLVIQHDVIIFELAVAEVGRAASSAGAAVYYGCQTEAEKKM